MRLLLDTQAFLWFISDDARLSANARAAIEEANNERLLSFASVWEIAIKQSIGKLSYTEPFDDFILKETRANYIDLLAIGLHDITAVATLPLHHRDPFDRLIVIQAKNRNLVLVSSDVAMDQYEVQRLW